MQLVSEFFTIIPLLLSHAAVLVIQDTTSEVEFCIERKPKEVRKAERELARRKQLRAQFKS